MIGCSNRAPTKEVWGGNSSWRGHHQGLHEGRSPVILTPEMGFLAVGIQPLLDVKLRNGSIHQGVDKTMMVTNRLQRLKGKIIELATATGWLGGVDVRV